MGTPLDLLSSNANVLKYINNPFKSMPGENTKLFFGVELELCCKKGDSDGRQECMKAIKDDLDDLAIMKSEGLANYGFETVTVPATLNFHRTRMWNKFATNAANLMQQDRGAGMHVHISQEAMTPDQQARMLFFYHNPVNWDFLTKIAERDNYGVTQIPKKLEDGAEDIIANSRSRYICCLSPHHACNTYEVRMFKSFPDRDKILKNIEFCHAVVTYCGMVGNDEKLLTSKEFSAWMQTSHNWLRYPYLTQFLKDSKVPYQPKPEETENLPF
jgi:hypothetical protein